jgi:ERCC4-type nuclease
MSCLKIVGAGVITIIAVVGALEERGEDLSPVDQAHRDYEAGRIDEQELEHRLAFHLDDRNEEIRQVVRQVNNVGEEISKDIAREFESLDELRRADREDLTAIHGVAESTADAVLARVRE